MTATDPTVKSLDGLFRALGVADLVALSDLADEKNEADTWVELTDEGIEVRCDTVGTGLAFTVGEFWEVVRETEGDQERAWELALDL
jgi:hypothetical protein